MCAGCEVWWMCCTYLWGRSYGRQHVLLEPFLDVGSLLMWGQLGSFDDIMSQLGVLVEGVDDVVKSKVDNEDACVRKWSMSIFNTMISSHTRTQQCHYIIVYTYIVIWCCEIVVYMYTMISDGGKYHCVECSPWCRHLGSGRRPGEWACRSSLEQQVWWMPWWSPAHLRC